MSNVPPPSPRRYGETPDSENPSLNASPAIPRPASPEPSGPPRPLPGRVSFPPELGQPTAPSSEEAAPLPAVAAPDLDLTEWDVVDLSKEPMITYMASLEKTMHPLTPTFSLTTGFSLQQLEQPLLNVNLNTEELMFNEIPPQQLLTRLKKRLEKSRKLPLAEQIKELQCLFTLAKSFATSLEKKLPELKTQLKESSFWEINLKNHLPNLIIICKEQRNAFATFCTHCETSIRSHNSTLQGASKAISTMSPQVINIEMSQPPFPEVINVLFKTTHAPLKLVINQVAMSSRFEPHAPENLLVCLQHKLEYAYTLPYTGKIKELKQTCAIANAFRNDLLQQRLDLEETLKQTPDSSLTLKENLTSLVKLTTQHFDAFNALFHSCIRKINALLANPL
jgi:hypothetical protein